MTDYFSLSYILVPAIAYIIYTIIGLLIIELRKSGIHIKEINIKSKIALLLVVLVILSFIPVFPFINIVGYLLNPNIAPYLLSPLFLMLYLFKIGLFIAPLILYEKIKSKDKNLQMGILLAFVIVYISGLFFSVDFSNAKVLDCQFSSRTEIAKTHFVSLAWLRTILGNPPASECLYEVAILEKDINICNRINESSGYFNQCYLEVAKGKEEISICEEIESVYVQGDCYTAMAEEKKDVTLCNQIKSEDSRKKLCYDSLAKILKDESICDMIDHDFSRDECVLKVALAKNDPNTCDKIKKTGHLRNSCYKYFEK